MKKRRSIKKKMGDGLQDSKKESALVSLLIDGIPVKVEPGTTILQAASAVNIKIPTLCYHEALSPYGACRLCVVEIKKNGWRKIQASCVCRAEEGCEVQTSTPELDNIRRMMIELIMARAPESKRVQDMAERLGVSQTRFTPRNDDCILCGLCVRMCSERMGQSVIGFAGRGDKRKISTPFDIQSERCLVCGACFSICPCASDSLRKLSNRPPRPLYDEFDQGLRQRSVIRIPFPQAVPNAAIIDKEHCVHFLDDKCKICQDLCEAKAIDFGQVDKLIDLRVGSIIVSSGSDVHKGKMKREFGYGRYDNVVTSIEFERILSASGPFHGHVLRPGDKKEPRRIAFVQCVGSRDEAHDYCSSVCCMYATKEAIIAKEHAPHLDCTIFCMDIRAFGKGFDEYYEKAMKSGIRYIHCRPASIDEVPGTKNIIIKYSDECEKTVLKEYDLVVLSCGLEPSRYLANLAERLDISVNKRGFFKTATFSPVESSREGIFVCGPCTEPKDIPETVTQSSAAAAKAMELLKDVRGTMITAKQYPPELPVHDQEPRIGVFVCHCGINIGGYVDVPQVLEYTRSLSKVVYAESNLYTCSQDSQKRMIELIGQHKLNRIVVASCTPRTHEPLFRETVREAGLNPYLFEMANIRDQCSWIHMNDPLAATRKAKDLVRMAVAKAGALAALKRVEIKVIQKALVIGGGVAGMAASLSLARQGFEVILVEKEHELGGNTRHIYYTIEENGVQDFLKKMVKEVYENDSIRVYTKANVESVSGFVGNYVSEIIVENGSRVICEHGVIIVATGAQEFTPDEYLYGQDDRVVTQRELEEMIADRDPAMSEVKSVVMIQCVGSRDDAHLYCSRRCCSQAMKNSLRLLEMNPNVKIYVLYRDVRTYGFKEEFYTEAREKGVLFIRFDSSNRPAVHGNNGSLKVVAFESLMQRNIEIKPDLLVLSAGIVPNTDNKRIAKMLKVPLNSDGYFLEAHVKLRPVDFATEGVFVAGLAHSPKFIIEAIAQAEASAARAATILANDKYYAEATISHVNEELCVGCGLCSNLCPYEAIEIKVKEGKRVSEVNEALCKGCGTCVAACASGAMDQYGFTKRQILGMISTLREW
ncbi:MAG: FAD-dependent oxidoreductase [candidate division WOR-3 bacterium]|nr:FAD-dependent oxidoreductase [candidate division WOR-3 bacterium]